MSTDRNSSPLLLIPAIHDKIIINIIRVLYRKWVNDMIYRPLEADEINCSLFSAFIRRQEVELCRRREGKKWVIKPDPFIDDWTEEDYQRIICDLKALCLSGGFVFGALEGDKLKGFSSVAPEKIGANREYLDLTHLHVSEDARRRGVGRRLFNAAADWARAQGAEKLYISAHSAVESQAFYSGMGCVDAAEYQQSHVDEEPFDCQLEFKLENK